MKVKILFIASEFSSGMIPFAAKIITSLYKNEFFDIYAIIVNSGNKSYKKLVNEINKKHVIQIEYPKSKLLKLVYKFYPYHIIKEIKNVDRKIKPDIIHLLTGDFTLAPYILTHKVDRRWYYTVHDLHPHETNSPNISHFLLHKYIVWGYKTLRDKIQNLTTSSISQFDELKNIYPRKNIGFTHFPSLLTKEMQNGNIKVPELKGIYDYILFFGTVDTYKGVDLLIRAYNESEKLQKMNLVIAGKGNDYSEVINGNKNIIRINRFIDDAEIKDLFEKSAFVVYPYKSATMSGVLSIAYYFKKRVLLSSIPFFCDNASSDSCFFDTGSIDDLQRKAEELSASNLTTDNNSYEEIYSENSLIEDYYKLYFDP